MTEGAAPVAVAKSGPWDALAARLVATAPQAGERRLRNLILSVNGLTINHKDEPTKNEILAIISRIGAGTLQTDLVSFLGQRYVVTTMHPGVYLAQHVNPATPSGVVFAQLDGAIAVSIYGAQTLPMEAMATVESSLYQTQAKRSRGDQ